MWIDCCRFVGAFISRKERLKDMGSNTRFTNLYVKNFANEFDENGLKEAFALYGPIVSAVVMRDKEAKSLGFGFVSFDNHESAAKVRSRADMMCVCEVPSSPGH